MHKSDIQRGRKSRIRFALLGLGLVVLCGASRLWASPDVLKLKNGVRLEGEWLNPDQVPRKTYEFRTPEGVRLVLPAEEVTDVAVPTELDKKYARALEKMPETAAAHWKMHELCRSQKLAEEAEFHLRQVLRLDPEHAEARERAGYSKDENGKWLTRDELLAQRGFVYHNHAWLTKQEAGLHNYLEQSEAARKQWKHDLMRWSRQLDGRKWEEAKQNILAIDDPAAIETLVTLLQREQIAERKRWYLEVIDRLGGGAATQAIVNAAIQDSDADIRAQCIEYLRGDRRTYAIVAATNRLSSKDPETLNRAAYVLDQLDGQTAIRPLIGALIVTKQIIVNTPGTQAGFDNTGGGGFSFSQGGGKTKQTQIIENPDVLAALRKLTGQDFRYDQAAWRTWYVDQYTPRNVSLRRDR